MYMVYSLSSPHLDSFYLNQCTLILFLFPYQSICPLLLISLFYIALSYPPSPVSVNPLPTSPLLIEVKLYNSSVIPILLTLCCVSVRHNMLYSSSFFKNSLTSMKCFISDNPCTFNSLILTLPPSLLDPPLV